MRRKCRSRKRMGRRAAAAAQMKMVTRHRAIQVGHRDCMFCGATVLPACIPAQ